MWISGNDSKIYQIDQSGSVLKTVNVSRNVYALSLNVKKELIFSVQWPDTNVLKYDSDVVSTVVDLGQWCPCGLCHSANGDLLVSMRSVDKSQSKIVRYSERVEIMVIRNDNRGKLLFSVCTSVVLHLTENDNGDICVADNAWNAVVVVNSSGDLRYKYWGIIVDVHPKSYHNSFTPSISATDVRQQILIKPRPRHRQRRQISPLHRTPL